MPCLTSMKLDRPFLYMQKGLKYIDCFSLLLIAIMFFLTAKGVLPLFVYSIVSIVVSFAIVPGKLFLISNNTRSGMTEIVIYVLSNLVIALLVALTILYLLIPKNNIISIYALILRLTNIFCMLYFIYKSRQKDAVFCLCGLFLPGSWGI